MPDDIKVTIEPRGEINLRKLARALIALAEQQLAAEEAATEASPSPKPGAAA